jgi:CHASE2 domain-containing sensor protein
MSRLVVLSLGQGSLEEGFPAVIVQFGEAGSAYTMKLTASLPMAPKISEIYRQWRSLYSAFYQRLPFRDAMVSEDDDFEIEEAYITNVSEIDIYELCQRMSDTINEWLDSNDFRRVEQQLRTQLKPTDEIRFIIETNDTLLRRLPWHLWNFFEDYPQAEIALSAVEYQRLPKNIVNTNKTKIKILAIFGDSSGIDINQDMKFLQKLSQEAEIQFVLEPQLSDLNDFLWEQGWDILFFAGHGVGEEEALIKINKTDRFPLDRLKYALKKAINGGLHLAIFNSCDSLNLAQQLQDLQIPQMIVMREPVPDIVAQEFLKYFLATFSEGQSLYASVRSARLRLHSLEDEFPCATWLPVLCHNPAEELMVWQVTPKMTPESNQLIEKEFSPQIYQLVDKLISPQFSPTKENNQKVASTNIENTPSQQNNQRVFKQKLQSKYRRIGLKKNNKFIFLKVLLSSILVAAFWIGVRNWGLIQNFELQAFDHLMNLRPFEQQDSRLSIITIDEKDIEYQHNNNMTMQGSLSDQALLQLLQKLDLYKPRAIGLDIYRDFPVNPQFSKLINHYRGDKNLFSVCKVPAPSDGVPDEIAPPSGFPKDRVSFSDFVADSDDTVRRQLLSMTPPTISRCVADKAFSFTLAMHYLNSRGYKYTFNSQQNLQINNITFQQLTSHTSGYQNLDASGYQILLNYRSLPSQQEIATQIPLREILKENVDDELINSLKNRIVLIGVTAPSTSDIWKTPLTNYPPNPGKIPGVFVQAQMISQIVSAVLDKRHLLWWFPKWMEIIWIWGWSFYGAMIGWGVKKTLHLATITATAILTLFALCFTFFIQGGWVPLIPSSLVLFSSILLIKLNFYSGSIDKAIDKTHFFEYSLVRQLSKDSHIHKKYKAYK